MMITLVLASPLSESELGQAFLAACFPGTSGRVAQICRLGQSVTIETSICMQSGEVIPQTVPSDKGYSQVHLDFSPGKERPAAAKLEPTKCLLTAKFLIKRLQNTGLVHQLIDFNPSTASSHPYKDLLRFIHAAHVQTALYAEGLESLYLRLIFKLCTLSGRPVEFILADHLQTLHSKRKACRVYTCGSSSNSAP
ncbi:hypothetical protein RRG08_055724 [Elysia crispata]|uniref:Uncharacterized protein n=1 Tax=Elysia crispata TaxID=231223 RepID=A0AAE1E800_9GAST|nr:hypothetical protein RRG08_055724 [Elysia crispata]